MEFGTKGYIAGSLFKDSDQRQRIYEKETLSKEVPNVEFFNPLTDNTSNDKSKLPTAKDVFLNDTMEVLKSDYIVAELDGEDVGMATEIGIAYGINYMLSALEYFKGTGCSYDSVINTVKMMIPPKQILAHASDIRLGTTNEYNGHHVPVGFNQFLVGCIEEMGTIYPHFEDIVQVLKDKEQNNI